MAKDEQGPNRSGGVSEHSASCRGLTTVLSRKLRQKLSSLAVLSLHRNSGTGGPSQTHQTVCLGPPQTWLHRNPKGIGAPDVP